MTGYDDVRWSLTDNERAKSVKAVKDIFGGGRYADQWVEAMEWMMENIYKERLEKMVSGLEKSSAHITTASRELSSGASVMRETLNFLKGIEEESDEESDS